MSNKRKFLKRLFFSSATLFGANTVIAKPEKVTGNKHGEFVHMVYIWLKEPDNKQHRKTFVKNTNAFMKEIDEVVSWYVGVPAKTPRDIVDNSYTFSILVTFKTREDHDIYQEHEAHKKFVKDTAMLWNKVQVYDSLRA